MFSRAFTVAKQVDTVTTPTGEKVTVIQAVRWNPRKNRFFLITLIKAGSDFVCYRDFWSMNWATGTWKQISFINGVSSGNEGKLGWYNQEKWKVREYRRQEIRDAAIPIINSGYLQKVLEDLNPSYKLSVEVVVDGFGNITSNVTHKGNLRINPFTIGYIEGMEAEMRFTASDMVEMHKEEVIRTFKHLGDKND